MKASKTTAEKLLMEIFLTINHSFYKQYGPDKQKYIEAWWKVINWDKVSEILEAVKL